MTLEELRDKHLKALAVAIEKGLSPDDCYQALAVIFDEALRAAEQRGIERAADVLDNFPLFVSAEPSQALFDFKNRFAGQMVKHIRALAQGGE